MQDGPPRRSQRTAVHAQFVSCPGSVDGLESRDDLLAPGLEEWRQHHLLAKRGLVLIHAEARPLRRNLEQNTVRLAEVEAAEPEAIHLAAVANTERIQPIRPHVVI